MHTQRIYSRFGKLPRMTDYTNLTCKMKSGLVQLYKLAVMILELVQMPSPADALCCQRCTDAMYFVKDCVSGRGKW